jgi:predicted ester cyclase
MSDQHKALVRRFFDEAYNGRNPRFFQEAYAEGANPDAAAHGGLPGAAGAERYLEMFLTAFPDLRVEILDLVAEFDVVCCRYVGRGTHTGPLMHLPPTGRAAEMEGLAYFRFEQGRIVESVNRYDAVGLARQLGLLPAPELR